MKIEYNQRSLKWDILFEEIDFANAGEIEALVNGHFACRKCGMQNVNRAWELLKGYFASAKEGLIFSQAKAWRTRPGRESAAFKDAQLDGFMQAAEMPENIIKQAKLMKDLQKKSKEVNRASREFNED